MNTDSRKSSPRRLLNIALKIIIPLIVSVGLCWILFRGDNLREMFDIMKNHCDYSWILAMLLVLLCSYTFRAIRWGLQLQAVGICVPLSTRLLSIFGTYAVNLVFPRLGEIWRCGFISHRSDSQFSVVAGTVIADRLADMLCGISFVIATLVFGHDALLRFVDRYPAFYESMQSILSSPWLWIGIATIIAATIWFLRSSGGGKIVERIRAFGRGMWDGFYGIRLIDHKWRWLALTIAIWGCYFFQMALAFQAFQLTRDIFAADGMLAVLVCFTLGSMAMGVPSNGGIGPFQVALIFGLSLYMPSEVDPVAFDLQAKAFANVVLGSTTLLSILLGLLTFASIALSRHRSTP